MRILGIDPGLATVGFSVVDTDKAKMKLVTCGVISTPAHTSLSSRLDRIFCDMNELISTFSPDVMSIEELFSIQILRPEYQLHMREVSYCLQLTAQEFGCLNTRRFRSSRLLSAMAGRKKIR